MTPYPYQADALVSQKFGRLTVVASHHKNSGRWWQCVCDCGREAIRSTGQLKASRISSCSDCSKKDRIERIVNLRRGKFSPYPRLLRKVYDAMIRRCYCEKDTFFHYYGGRGIRVCDEWRSDRTAFFKWALSSGYGVGVSIDRINNDWDYSPHNCRWTDKGTQSRNRRFAHQVCWNGKTQTLAEWARELGVKKQSLWHRFNAGWTVERMMTEAYS